MSLVPQPGTSSFSRSFSRSFSPSRCQAANLVRELGLGVVKRELKRQRSKAEREERAEKGVWLVLEDAGYVGHKLPHGAIVFSSTPEMDARPDVLGLAEEMNSPPVLKAMEEELEKGGKVSWGQGRMHEARASRGKVATGRAHADSDPPSVACRRPTGRWSSPRSGTRMVCLRACWARPRWCWAR